MAGGERILIVDDDRQVRRLVTRILEGAGYDCEAAPSAATARTKLDEGPFALVLCDVYMPGGSGIELVDEVRRSSPEIATLMVSGEDGETVSAEALASGVYGYVVKPFRPRELLINVASALRRRQLDGQSREHQKGLETTVAARTQALRKAIGALERSTEAVRESRVDTIRSLARAVEYRDRETAGHIERMSRYCELLAGRLGLDPGAALMASPMHDVGKVAVPDAILLKPGPLNRDERSAMERHTEVGREILTGTDSQLLDLAAVIAWTHHERFDGTGYPRGLEGEDIPLEGRIAAVADVFDALTSDRCYRRAFSLETSIEMMRAERGAHFDPVILDTFLAEVDEVTAIRDRYAEGMPDALAARGSLRTTS